MPYVKFKTALKYAARGWIGSGVLAAGFGLYSVHTAPVIPDADAMISEKVASAVMFWTEESGSDGDSFAAGIAAYELASALHDPRWASAAVKKLSAAQGAFPQIAQIKAWRGVAHSLISRDFPVQGYWQAMPGPGFVRIYHVRKAVAYLDKAVAADPADPVSRLLRAVTLSQMPAILVPHETMQADFALMAQWAADPGQNPAYQDVLTSDQWRTDFLELSAQAYEKHGQTQMAAVQWHLLVAETNIPEIKERAQWNAARLTQ